MYRQHFQQSMNQPGMVAYPGHCQRNSENIYFSLSPFAPDHWSRETGSAAPSRASLLILHAQDEYYNSVYFVGATAKTVKARRLL